MLTKIEKNLQVEFTFAATHPKYRLKKIEQKGDIPPWLAEMEPSLLKGF